MRKHRREGPDVGPVAARAAPDTSPGAGSTTGASRVAGYRLVRVLGEGASAVVHLGCADPATDGEPRRTAAVKIFRAGVPLDRIDAEVAALSAGEHPHVVRLLDLATAPDGRPCLVLERCTTSGLAQLVTARTDLEAGEALTILAPIADAVVALHTAGVAHRAIRLSSVLFRDSGAPVLAGLGASVRIAPRMSPAGLASTAAVLDDRRRLGRVVGTVLERVDHPAARDLEGWLGTQPEALDDFPARLADALWKLGEARPVRLRDETGERPARAVAPRPTATPAPMGTPAPTGRPVPMAPMPMHRSAHRSPLRSRADPPGTGLPGEAIARARASIQTLIGHARGVRRPVWITAAGVAVSLVVAVFVVPTGEPAAQGPRAELGERTSGGGGGGATEQPATEGDPAPEDDPVRGDDPVAALVALLDERARCLRDLSVLCLDGVVQPGSSAMEHDVALVRALQEGGERSADAAIDTVGPVLVERLGDSALLDLGDVPQTQPASTLVMRGEAGWRIRDYLGDGSD